MRTDGLLLRSLVFLVMVFPYGCADGGDGEGSTGNNQGSVPAAAVGVVSGGLSVPPNNAVEAEPNQTIPQAQALTETSSVSGRAAVGDPGFIIPGTGGRVAQDLFRINATQGLRIVLRIAEDDLTANDLDLILMDASGSVVDTSEAANSSTEFLETGAGGDFVIGVRASGGASEYLLTLSPQTVVTGVLSDIIPFGAQIVPGEVLVRMKEDIKGTQSRASLAAGHGLSHTRSLPSGVEVMTVDPLAPASPQSGKGRLSRKETIGTYLGMPRSETNILTALTADRIRKLRKDPRVEYAEPNIIRRPFAVPNDQFFDLQWHYQLINLPQAWDRTTGSNTTTVAVLDTGIVATHPDFASRLLPGFDFITDPANARDGDGIDPDPNDDGDLGNPGGQTSTFHGTHVAGTVGAATNNAVGVAGTTWQTRLMPLRVLGTFGGTDLDIAQAIRYAAGLPNSSGTVPPDRAHIINMSLGGPGFSQTLANAVQAARSEGVIIVAASGNDGQARINYPASLNGVISVAAVDINSTRAFYSTFASTVDVAAPGGDNRVDLNLDGQPDGVLSTLASDATSPLSFTYGFYQGTSMATPHIAGVIALMLAVNPTLTPLDIDQFLAGTHPSTSVPITLDLGDPGRDDSYGHGLIQASQAVQAALAVPGGTGPPPAGSALSVSTSILDFQNFLTSLPLTIINSGIGTLRVTNITVTAPWVMVSPTSGVAPITATVTVDRSSLPPGMHSATITVFSDATTGNPTKDILVDLTVGGSVLGDVGLVFVLFLDVTTLNTVEQTVTDSSLGYQFTSPGLTAGTYFLVAGTDRDDNGFICESEDACGILSEPLTIASGQTISNVNLVVANSFQEPQLLAVVLRSPQAATLKSYPPGFSETGPVKFRRKL